MSDPINNKHGIQQAPHSEQALSERRKTTTTPVTKPSSVKSTNHATLKEQAATTSHAAVMAEALDGDAAEATMAAQAGRRASGRGDDDQNPQSNEIEKPRSARPAVNAPEKVVELAPDDDPLSKLRASKAGNNKSSAVRQAAPTSTTETSIATQAHERLMIMSSTMKPHEVSSLLGAERMEVLKAVLSKPDSIPDRQAAKDVLCQQMNITRQSVA